MKWTDLGRCGGYQIALAAGFAMISAFPAVAAPAAARTKELEVGTAGHAFDHLGDIGEQAETAAACGATIIYSSGVGAAGYQGLPNQDELKREVAAPKAYLRNAKKHGIHLAVGYVCATSIVRLETFDKNWTDSLRKQFSSPPSEWLQQDSEQKALASWYGGDYRPACMNHPDWRAYEKFIVRQQLKAGHDGIFFDNPTVHPRGCYCRHCLEKFAQFILLSTNASGQTASTSQSASGPGRTGKRDQTAETSFWREYALKHPTDFMRFRCTIARDFLAEMRAFARTIKHDALITCNNSLNSPEVFFSQCRTHGYNIDELSKAEDFIVVEDMTSQPRMLPGGTTMEYGSTYEMIRAISHGKPIVAVTIAQGDYHTPPNLMRLAMAEAAAHQASYLAWPTWPPEVRPRMIDAVRPEADFLRQNAALLNNTMPRADVLLFLPFRQWTERTECREGQIASELLRANIQFQVVTEDDGILSSRAAQKELKRDESAQILLIQPASTSLPGVQAPIDRFQQDGGQVVYDGPGWLSNLQQQLKEPSLRLEAPATMRAVVRDQPHKTIVHLYNLNLNRVSSYQDYLTPALDIKLTVRAPFGPVRSVRVLTADRRGTTGTLKYSVDRQNRESIITVTVPRVEVSSMIVIE